MSAARRPENVAASVRARLQNLARRRKVEFQPVLGLVEKGMLTAAGQTQSPLIRCGKWTWRNFASDSRHRLRQDPSAA